MRVVFSVAGVRHHLKQVRIWLLLRHEPTRVRTLLAGRSTDGQTFASSALGSGSVSMTDLCGSDEDAVYDWDDAFKLNLKECRASHDDGVGDNAGAFPANAVETLDAV